MFGINSYGHNFKRGEKEYTGTLLLSFEIWRSEEKKGLKSGVMVLKTCL